MASNPVTQSRVVDAVVIGAGHNGLVAANYLADSGLDVVVLEAGGQIGGMSSSAYSIPEAPEHLVNHCAVDPIMWSAGPPARELALDEYGLRMVEVDPPFAYLDSDGASIAFWRDAARTAEEIRRLSPRDASAYLEFARFLDALYDLAQPVMASHPGRPDLTTARYVTRAALRHRRRLPGLVHFLLSSGKEAIAERFEHPVVRSALHVACGSTMSSSIPGSALQFMLLACVHRVRCLRPVGGTQAIPDALAARLRARKGEVLTGALVSDIMVESGRATGVLLADGREIVARRAVVSTSDPSQTLGRLLPAGTLPDELEKRVRAIPSNGFGWGQMKIDIACSAHIDLSRHERDRRDDLDLRIPSHWIGTEQGIERAYAASTAGLLPVDEDLVFYNAVPTAVDSSQAPDGMDSLYLLSVAVPFAPAEGWEKLKDDASSAAVGRAAQFYGGLTEMEIGRQVHTHEDIAVVQHVTGGCHPHVDQVLSRMGPFRPALGLGGFSTPVEALYLAGSGAHPGGGVTGLPGYLGAKTVLRDVRAHRRVRRSG